jgi:hypothetical protein
MKNSLTRLFLFTIAIVWLNQKQLDAQVLTREDSLNAGLVRKDGTTLISGYGEAKVNYDLRYGSGRASLTRNVLFIGHRFSRRIYLFSEMELANARVEAGNAAGEISMEQLFLKFSITRDIYLTAGLFIPRIGLINENHLPTTFNGTDRPFCEQLIIPSTWRELGVGIYGQTPRIPGLNWSAAVINGLNAEGFGGGKGIRGGKFDGSNATATNLAVTGALLYYIGPFRFQTSGYLGGAAGLSRREADSLMLESGVFGSPVMLGEGSAQFLSNRWMVKVQATYISIPEAFVINRAYANNTPEAIWGAQAEIGLNLLSFFKVEEKKLMVFARYEQIDLNAQTPDNGIATDELRQKYIIGGITWQPVRGVAVKADYVQRITGEQNTALLINPFLNTLPFYTSRGFVNLGIAYSF